MPLNGSRQRISQDLVNKYLWDNNADCEYVELEGVTV